MLKDTQKSKITSSFTKKRKVLHILIFPVFLFILISLGDSKIRAQIDLRQAKIKKSLKLQQDANYIQISLNKDSILIAIENIDDFKNWVACIEFNQKTDEEQRDILSKQSL